MTTGRPTGLPDFDSPPLIETVLSLQFEPIAGWTSAHAGRFWQSLGNKFATIEEQPPLPHIIERFGPPTPPTMEVKVEDRPPANRIWFLSSSKDQLLQLQADRFVRNWRKVEATDAYPRYEQLRARFWDELEAFQQFLRDAALGPLSINQCEVTYINHIDLDGSDHRGGLDRVITGALAWPSGSFLPVANYMALTARFEMRPAQAPQDREPAGRLHFSAQPAWKRTGNSPIMVVTLTARGAPLGAGASGAFDFLDLGRQWIVSGFKDTTTPEMHQTWGLHHG